MSYTAAAYPSRCVNVMHLEGGPKTRHESIACVLVKAATESEIEAIRSVDFGGYRADVAPHLGTVWHPGSHCDPFAPFFADGAWCAEIIVYEPHHVGEGCSGTIIDTSGEMHQVHVQVAGVEPDWGLLETEFDPATATLRISSHSSTEIVWQTVEAGSFRERIQLCEPGDHEMLVDPGHCEAYGVCVSIGGHEEGSLEHKHMIFGHFGEGSGRHLLDLDSGNVIPPRGQHRFAYRSCVARVTEAEQLDRLAKIKDGWSEIDVFVPFHMAELAHAKATGPRTKITTYGNTGSGADITVHGVCPSDATGTFSILLFADPHTFRERLPSALKAAKECRRGFFDYTWLGVESAPAVGEPSDACYGAGFSLPHEPSEYSIRKSRAVDRRRTLLKHSQCFDCETFQKCRISTPFPHSAEHAFLPPQISDDKCELRHQMTGDSFEVEETDSSAL